MEGGPQFLKDERAVYYVPHAIPGHSSWMVVAVVVLKSRICTPVVSVATTTPSILCNHD